MQISVQDLLNSKQFSTHTSATLVEETTFDDDDDEGDDKYSLN